MQLPFALPAHIRAGVLFAGQVIKLPRIEPRRLTGLLAGPAAHGVHHRRAQVRAEAALAGVVFQTIHRLEQVQFHVLHDILGVGVVGPPSAGVPVKQSPVTLVKLLPAQLVRPIAKPQQETQMRRVGVAHYT